MLIQDALLDLTIFKCPYNFRGLPFHFGALGYAYIAMVFTITSKEVLHMKISADHKADLGKVLESHLKVSHGQTQLTWLLPPHTQPHTC